jgi:hypothetical protein
LDAGAISDLDFMLVNHWQAHRVTEIVYEVMAAKESGLHHLAHASSPDY